MNRRNFLKWLGFASAVVASPKIEAAAKEVVKVTEPQKKIWTFPTSLLCTSGGVALGGKYKTCYDHRGNLIGWEANNMAAIIGIVGLIFGKGTPLPPVPEGWEYIEDENNFLMILSPEGKRYFVEKQNGFLRIVLATPNANQNRKPYESEWVYDELEQKTLCVWPDE